MSSAAPCDTAANNPNTHQALAAATAASTSAAVALLHCISGRPVLGLNTVKVEPSLASLHSLLMNSWLRRCGVEDIREVALQKREGAKK